MGLAQGTLDCVRRRPARKQEAEVAIALGKGNDRAPARNGDLEAVDPRHGAGLVLTVDLQVIGQRHADIKNGMTVPPEWTLSKLFDFATKPAWVSGVLRGKRRTFGNLVGHLKGTDDITALGTWIATQFDTTLNWKDVEWIRSIWPGKLILKGVLDV